jgi:hypothetical protein
MAAPAWRNVSLALLTLYKMLLSPLFTDPRFVVLGLRPQAVMVHGTVKGSGSARAALPAGSAGSIRFRRQPANFVEPDVANGKRVLIAVALFSWCRATRRSSAPKTPTQTVARPR